MNIRSVLYGFAVIGTAFLAEASFAEDLTAQFDAKHKTCLENIAIDADLAFEDAMIWRGDGGGRRARHCEAMALFALGHKEEAARRLDILAKTPDAGNKIMQSNYYAEAADFWLMANKPEDAYASATAGLALRKDNVALRIARARAYALQGRYDHAETDLTSALAFEPGHAGALRYRADARFEQGKIQDAKTDIEASLNADPNSVETALLRGRINEALRETAMIRVNQTKTD
ncbi:MAG: tetratricopeptide repeat protein [Alphaproteobacteria bacterium]